MTLDNLELTRFFFAVVCLLVAAHVFGFVFQHFRMPRVIGEIFGGMLLGPTVLGHFRPDLYTWVFNAFEFEGKLVASLYWLGVVFLMFVSGFEIQTAFNKEDRRIVAMLILGTITLPFAAGWVLPTLVDVSGLIGPHGNGGPFRIVLAIAVAVTSIPVISRIFMELDIMQSRFAKIVLAVATIEDVMLWVALAIATGLATGGNASLRGILMTVIITLVFFGVSLAVIPKVMLYGNKLRVNLLLKSSPAGYALFICFLFSAVASLLNVNLVFGALLAGVTVGTLPGNRFTIVKANIKEFAMAFFVPIYFAVVGLKLNLVRDFDPMLFLWFTLFCVFVKTIGVFLGTRLAHRDWSDSVNLAVALNARGGPGIILATIAFDMGIIAPSFFVTLVLLALVTSLLSGYWLRMVISNHRPLLKEALAGTEDQSLKAAGKKIEKVSFPISR